MFQVGPLELMLVFVVALLVIGPERLPGAARTAGLWIGRFRRSFHRIRSEIEQELNADEIRRQLHNEAILEEVENVKKHTRTVADELQKTAASVEAVGDEARNTALKLEQDVKSDDADANQEQPKSTDLG